MSSSNSTPSNTTDQSAKDNIPAKTSATRSKRKRKTKKKSFEIKVTDKTLEIVTPTGTTFQLQQNKVSTNDQAIPPPLPAPPIGKSTANDSVHNDSPGRPNPKPSTWRRIKKHIHWIHWFPLLFHLWQYIFAHAPSVLTTT
jgi:hypothetical protein